MCAQSLHCSTLAMLPRCHGWLQAEDAKYGTGELAANLEAAWGRLYIARLDASLDFRDGKTAPPDSSSRELPDYLHLPALRLPPASELPHGAAAYASNFEQARDLFNAGVKRARTALEYFRLDGWVTLHIELLFDISKAYGYASTLVCSRGVSVTALQNACILAQHRISLLRPMFAC